MDGSHAPTDDGVVEAAGRNIEALKTQLAAIQTDLAGLSKLLLGRAGNGVMENVKKVAEGGRGAIAGTEQKVRDWPLLSLLVAFFVGLVFGRVVLRK